MKTSKIVTFAAVIAVTATALLFGAASFFPKGASNTAQAPDPASAPVATASLDPIVVVAVR